MDEKQLESQSRLLIELGEPETWLETMLRAARRSGTHAASQGDEELAKRWRNLAKGLEYAVAATVNDPIAGGPLDTETQPRMGQRELTQADLNAAIAQQQSFAGRQNVGTPAAPIAETSQSQGEAPIAANPATQAQTSDC